MFDKDITIVNKWFNKETKINEYKISHLKGFWSSNKGVTISNTQLVIDKSNEREVHNKYLCRLLEDKKLYNDFLKGMLQNIEIQILPYYLMGCLPKNRNKQIRTLIRSLYHVLKGVDLTKYTDELKISLNNIAKRELIKRLLNN